METYGDSIEDLGAYYENAKLTIAVLEYSDLNSIEDLAGAGDCFGGKIIGIKPGAGRSSQTHRIIPKYGLDGEYELVTSLTAAMLTELKKVTDRQEDIVVALWPPFWANDASPVKDLEYPRVAMGEAVSLHFLGTSDLAEEFPDAARLIG